MALDWKEIRRLDLNSEEHGVPVRTLMARAGKALAQAARGARKGRLAEAPVIILCGKGNNGGDGFAAAGALQRWNIPTTVVLLPAKRDVGLIPAAYLDLLPAKTVVAWKGARNANWAGAVVVDCMLGSGSHGTPRAPYAAAIAWANQHAGTTIACDVPSGLGTSCSIAPATTITFHAKKVGMTQANCGTIRVVSIGIPIAARDIGLGDLDAGFIRRRNAHKGDNGRVLIVAGGPFTGAAHYAGMGAVRAGADLVHVATTRNAAATIASWGPDLLVHDVEDSDHLSTAAWPAIAALAVHADVIVIGPGLGDAAETRALVKLVLAKTKHPMVIDADGLDAVDDKTRPCILTPHGREFRDLTGWKPTRANVAKYAKNSGHVIVCKGATDIVAGPTARDCHRGHPGMTVGGTGDVLAGAIGALLARGAPPWDAACAGTYLTGCAGEIAGAMFSHGLTATDVVQAIPAVLQRLD